MYLSIASAKRLCCSSFSSAKRTFSSFNFRRRSLFASNSARIRSFSCSWASWIFASFSCLIFHRSCTNWSYSCHFRCVSWRKCSSDCWRASSKASCSARKVRYDGDDIFMQFSRTQNNQIFLKSFFHYVYYSFQAVDLVLWQLFDDNFSFGFSLQFYAILCGFFFNNLKKKIHFIKAE